MQKTHCERLLAAPVRQCFTAAGGSGHRRQQQQRPGTRRRAGTPPRAQPEDLDLVERFVGEHRLMCLAPLRCLPDLENVMAGSHQGCLAYLPPSYLDTCAWPVVLPRQAVWPCCAGGSHSWRLEAAF